MLILELGQALREIESGDGRAAAYLVSFEFIEESRLCFVLYFLPRDVRPELSRREVMSSSGFNQRVRVKS